jgi:hypothetical protein
MLSKHLKDDLIIHVIKLLLQGKELELTRDQLVKL